MAVTLTVQGVPNNFNQGLLEEMLRNLEVNVRTHKALNLNENEVFLFFPKDILHMGLGDEIIVTVEGIPYDTKLTKTTRNQIAEAVGKVITMYFPKAYIEVQVRKFQFQEGHWKSR